MASSFPGYCRHVQRPLAVRPLAPSQGHRGRMAPGRCADGDRLEGIQHRFIDAGTYEGFNTRRRWTSRGSADTLAKAPQSQAVRYWLMQLQHGEGGYWPPVKIITGSSTLLDREPQISPDQLRWAAGACGDALGACRSSKLTGLAISQWQGTAPVFPAATSWAGTQTRQASGPATRPRERASEDRLDRDGEGRWSGTRTGLEPVNSQRSQRQKAFACHNLHPCGSAGGGRAQPPGVRRRNKTAPQPSVSRTKDASPPRESLLGGQATPIIRRIHGTR